MMPEPNRIPYTHEELRALRQKLEDGLANVERQHPEVQPLPPMEEEEARSLLLGFTETAAVRLLTGAESFLCGQLLANYRMAVEARMLGKRGRYFVVSQDYIDRAISGKK